MDKKKVVSVVQLTVSIVLLLILFRRIGLESFFDLLASIHPGYFTLGVLCYFLSMVVISFRWQFIVQTANEPAGIFQLIGINFVGSFFSMFLPTAAGGDVARMYESSRRGMVGTKAVSTVLLDRVIGLLSLVLICIAALLAGYRFSGNSWLVYLVIGLAAVMGISWRLFFDLRVARRVKGVFRLPLLARFESGAAGLYQSLYDLQQQPRLLLSSLAISIAAQAIEIFSAIFLARSLGINSEGFYFFVFIPLIWLVTMLPVSLNGLGLREGAFAFFFGQIGVVSAEAISLSLLVYLCRVLAGLFGGFLFLWASMNDSLRKWIRGGKEPL